MLNLERKYYALRDSGATEAPNRIQKMLDSLSETEKYRAFLRLTSVCRGFLGRLRFKKLRLFKLAAQTGVLVAMKNTIQGEIYCCYFSCVFLLISLCMICVCFHLSGFNLVKVKASSVCNVCRFHSDFYFYLHLIRLRRVWLVRGTQRKHFLLCAQKCEFQIIISLFSVVVIMLT